jgi:hypothetical protein
MMSLCACKIASSIKTYNSVDDKCRRRCKTCKKALQDAVYASQAIVTGEVAMTLTEAAFVDRPVSRIDSLSPRW